MIEYRFDCIIDDNVRKQVWIDNVYDLFDTKFGINTHVPLSSSQKIYNLKRLIFAEINGTDRTIERTLSRIEAQNIDYVNLALHKSG